jgi:hypothetical protein
MIVKTQLLIDDGRFKQVVDFEFIDQVRSMKDENEAKALIKAKYLLSDFDTDTLYHCITKSKDTSNL